MNRDDERLRDAIMDGLARAGIDAHALTIDVIGGAVIIRGSVPTDDKRRRLGQAVATAVPGLAWRIDVTVQPIATRESAGARSRKSLLSWRHGDPGTARRTL
ncbi:MAG: BON domain-containing protein [Alphaproteobacteria bacterium]|nr:BON domain-containing protein [Alphaproteobacteria bacterium]